MNTSIKRVKFYQIGQAYVSANLFWNLWDTSILQEALASHGEMKAALEAGQVVKAGNLVFQIVYAEQEGESS